MKKQTAVEYLIQYMMNNQYFVGNDLEDYLLLADVFEQAKAMEREQMLKLISFVRMHNKMGKSADHLLQEFETYKGGSNE